jgi:hypothetical protein
MMIAEGVDPEDNQFSRGIIEMREERNCRFRFAARQSYNTPRRKLFQARRQVFNVMN